MFVQEGQELFLVLRWHELEVSERLQGNKKRCKVLLILCGSQLLSFVNCRSTRMQNPKRSSLGRSRSLRISRRSQESEISDNYAMSKRNLREFRYF